MKKTDEKVPARVLRDCEFGQPDDVVLLTPQEAKHAAENGQVDTDKAAVAYAESLARNQYPPE